MSCIKIQTSKRRTDWLQSPFGCKRIHRLKLLEKMLRTDLQEANGKNGNEIISEGQEFNRAAASLQTITTAESVICLTVFEAESQNTTHGTSFGAAEGFWEELFEAQAFCLKN